MQSNHNAWDDDADGLERFRPYLHMLARTHLGPNGKARLEASDIVQQTMLEAHCQLAQFRGGTSEEMAVWLKKMLSSNMADAHRALHRQKRDIVRERPLDTTLDQSCSRVEAWLEAVQTSPSGRVSRNEQLVRLACAMSQLPSDQRDAIEIHHLQGLSLAETASQMGKSFGSVAGLLRRGLSRLRELLSENDSSH